MISDQDYKDEYKRQQKILNNQMKEAFQYHKIDMVPGMVRLVAQALLDAHISGFTHITPKDIMFNIEIIKNIKNFRFDESLEKLLDED